MGVLGGQVLMELLVSLVIDHLGDLNCQWLLNDTNAEDREG